MPLFCANLFFSFFAVVGRVGENISLPLWVDSTNGNLSGRSVDSYFVLSFASLSFVVIFGLATLFIRIYSPQDIGETEKRFPQLLLFLIGLCDALNGAMIVFASKGSRTPPYLQAILGNFGISFNHVIQGGLRIISPGDPSNNDHNLNRMALLGHGSEEHYHSLDNVGTLSTEKGEDVVHYMKKKWRRKDLRGIFAQSAVGSSIAFQREFLRMTVVQYYADCYACEVCCKNEEWYSYPM